MTTAPYTITELADEDRKVAEIVAPATPSPDEYRPLHWLPSAGLMPSDFFLPGLA